MALAAITLAQRSAHPQRTYGTYRLGVLAAPPQVPGLPMLAVAAIGLAVSLISFRLLTAGSKESLNVRGAYLEVISDMLGPVGVIAAAVITLTTGWRYADPLAQLADSTGPVQVGAWLRRSRVRWSI